MVVQNEKDNKPSRCILEPRLLLHGSARLPGSTILKRVSTICSQRPGHEIACSTVMSICSSLAELSVHVPSKRPMPKSTICVYRNMLN